MEDVLIGPLAVVFHELSPNKQPFPHLHPTSNPQEASNFAVPASVSPQVYPRTPFS